MTYRRRVSVEIQTHLAAIVLRDPALHLVKYVRNGEIDLEETKVASLKMRYMVLQQRPYSTAFIQLYSPNTTFWSVGHSKCIGVHNGRKPDEWNPEEGMRLAIARAATDIGDQIHGKVIVVEEIRHEDFDYE